MLRVSTRSLLDVLRPMDTKLSVVLRSECRPNLRNWVGNLEALALKIGLPDTPYFTRSPVFQPQSPTSRNEATREMKSPVFKLRPLTSHQSPIHRLYFLYWNTHLIRAQIYRHCKRNKIKGCQNQSSNLQLILLIHAMSLESKYFENVF